jgi:hypothetical protein
MCKKTNIVVHPTLRVFRHLGLYQGKKTQWHDGVSLPILSALAARRPLGLCSCCCSCCWSVPFRVHRTKGQRLQPICACYGGLSSHGVSWQWPWRVVVGLRVKKCTTFEIILRGRVRDSKGQLTQTSYASSQHASARQTGAKSKEQRSVDRSVHHDLVSAEAGRVVHVRLALVQNIGFQIRHAQLQLLQIPIGLHRVCILGVAAPESDTSQSSRHDCEWEEF